MSHNSGEKSSNNEMKHVIVKASIMSEWLQGDLMMQHECNISGAAGRIDKSLQQV